VRAPQEPRVRTSRTGVVELREASFSYPGAQEAVLRGASLLARPGETTAIVGSTGAGKSTLLNLIPRLVDVTGGTVLVDGLDVRLLDPADLRSSIGLVPQRPYLFGGTVATNLRYGKADATDEELWAALDIAQARGFVEAMPQGLNSVIAQGGTNVSGGQRQRLAIARAVANRPAILIADEPTANLDADSAAGIMEIFVSFRQVGVTVLIATHDLTPIVAHAQQIARERFSAGYDLSEVQSAFNALEAATWARVLATLPPDRFARTLGLVSTILGAGKDALARTYVSLATDAHAPSLDLRALFAGTDSA